MQDFSHIKCSRFEEKSYFTALDLRCVKVKHCIKSNTNHFEGKLHRFFPGLFSDSYTSQIANLKKKKIGKLIPVPVTAKSRREYKHRGRVVGIAGRRHKDQKSRKQMVINDDSEIVYHTLPKQKKTKNKQSHSLKDAVDNNRPGAKKH